ncbi:putative GTP binding domain, P-loop containing nucleoside triphosphate hydrolase [Dioscorea sansibarensis]
MAVTSLFAERVGAIVREVSLKKATGGLYGPRMAAFERAIVERVPLVDLVVEVRDARIPLTSAFGPLRHLACSHKQMIVLNKVDLADRSLTEMWLRHFKLQNFICYGVNSHNKDSISELLRVVRARIRKLKGDDRSYTATMLLVGIPNVGKSAMVNSMHQIGRTGAEVKGKLKHATVSSQPGETKDIISYKIGSHPNIYVLDTPGVLSGEIVDDDLGSKLALSGAIIDSLVGEVDLARYFLSVLNSKEEYKRWENLKTDADDAILSTSEFNQRRRRQYPSDHTQDFIVRDVRRTLFRCISSNPVNLENENTWKRLIDNQLTALHEPFRLPEEPCEDSYKAVARKLLNLFRTGRLGHYTFDILP